MKPNKKPSTFSKVLILTTIAVCVAVLLLSSCVTEKQRARICATCALKETVKDSIGKAEVKFIPFDTAILVKDRIGKDLEFINCDSLYAFLTRHNDSLIAKANGVKSTVVRRGKAISFRCETDSLKAVIELLKKEKSVTVYKTITREVPARCVKEHRTWIDGLYKRGFFVLLLIVSGTIAYRYRRFFIR